MVRTKAILVAAASLLLALAISAAGTRFIAPLHPQISVRWQVGLTESERVEVERRLGLQPVRLESPDTWRYELTNASRDTIEAIVTDPAVDDTHFVNRQTFDLSDDAPRSLRRPSALAQRWPVITAMLDAGPILFNILGAIAALFAAWPSLATGSRRMLVQLLTRGVHFLSLSWGALENDSTQLPPRPARVGTELRWQLAVASGASIVFSIPLLLKGTPDLPLYP